MRQPKRTLNNSPENSRPQKKISRKHAQAPSTPSTTALLSTPNVDTTGRGSRPVRARIFRDGHSYIPPAIMQPAPAASSSSTRLSDDGYGHRQNAHHHGSPNRPSTADRPPLERPSSQEACHPNFLNPCLLTDMQTVGRRVRLLLPEDGSIVYPSSMPGSPASTTAPIPAIPEPDPSSWASQYVCHPILYWHESNSWPLSI